MKEPFVNLSQLQAEYQGRKIPYQVLLSTNEWRKRREEIIKRDGCKCTKCGTEASFWYQGTSVSTGSYIDANGEEQVWSTVGSNLIVLHVHHLYYVQSRMPWDYKDTALVTLCNDCHLEVHEQESIPVYKTSSKQSIVPAVQTCSRCRGAGYFPEYKHRDAGVCYECKGERYVNLVL